MKLNINLKTIMCYIMISALYIVLGIMSLALIIFGMIYIMDSINIVDTILGVWLLISPIILAIGTNKFILNFEKTVGVGKRKHLILWNGLAVITIILVYNII